MGQPAAGPSVGFAIKTASTVQSLVEEHASFSGCLNPRCGDNNNRGWDKLRLLSAGNNTFKYDLGSEDREGGQDSIVSVFTRDAKGTLRHFYTAHPRMAPDIQERGIDLLTPIWHFMDLTPQGRGSWYASLAYGTKVQAA